MKLKNVLIVVKNIEESKKYYHDLFNLDVILDNDGNVILTEGLVLQDRKIWKNFFDTLNDDEALTLAKKYNFSGGQIENIARKSQIDEIIDDIKLTYTKLCEYSDEEFINDKKRAIGF